MAVLTKVEVLAINIGLKLVKQGEAKRRMLMRKFAIQHRIPMYIGEQEKLYGVPVEYFSSIMMNALINTFEDQASMGPIKLSCSEEMFKLIMDLVKDEKSSNVAKEDDGRATEFHQFGRISSICNK